MAQKNVLVLGASGAMGQYLVPILAEKGFHVDAVALDDQVSNHPNITWHKGNAKEFKFRNEILSRHYDGIVDFLIYTTNDLHVCLPGILSASDHYIYLSTYRIYNGLENPTRETSPRLLDSSDDVMLVNSDDYSIYKARGENVIRNCFADKNWTIIRPAITYSRHRYQLVTLEAPDTVCRARRGKSVLVPETAKNVQATMSWAGDVAQMIAGLLFNEKALHETFTVATAEHHTWGEIAEYYKDICGLNAIWIPQEEYLKCICNNNTQYYYPCKWQLAYDRLFDRVMDNSKVLAATGMKQENLRTLYDGLKYEISRCTQEFVDKTAEYESNLNMDRYLQENGLA